MQALELLHSEFDIDLLLDINMPRLDGFGVLEVMKQRNWLQEIPVIITSSEDDESFIQKAYELGVTDYIRRPFNLTVTQRRVSNALTLYARQKHLVHLAEEQVYEHEKTNSAIINILSHVVESRNFESGTHILHVRAITDILLRQLVAATNRCPLSQADISMISTLSALHDIGKIAIDEKILNRTNIYLSAYVIIIAVSFLLISTDGLSPTTNFSAVLACFNNIGPGLEAVGPTANFCSFNVFSKIILILDMLAGRLEIFPILVLFSHSTWKKS